MIDTFVFYFPEFSFPLRRNSPGSSCERRSVLSIPFAELGIQTLEVCIAARAVSGVLVPMSKLLAAVRKKRARCALVHVAGRGGQPGE